MSVLFSIVAWVVDIACFSRQVDQNEQILHLLFCLFYLSLLTLLFLLLHYYQFSSSFLSLPIVVTVSVICFCSPEFIRSFLHLIPSINILSDASSFPLYILFHDIFPLPFLRILSLGKKIFSLVYCVKEVSFPVFSHFQGFDSIRRTTRQVRFIPSLVIPSLNTMKQFESPWLPLFRLWIRTVLIIVYNPLFVCLSLTILQYSFLPSKFGIFLFPLLFIETSLYGIWWQHVRIFSFP